MQGRFGTASAITLILLTSTVGCGASKTTDAGISSAPPIDFAMPCTSDSCPAGSTCDTTSGLCEENDAGPIAPSSDAGTLKTIASGLDGPTSLSSQGTALYFSENDLRGSLNGVATAEGSSPSTVESGRNYATVVVTDATNIYWIEQGTFDCTQTSCTYNNDGAVLQAALTGGAVVTVASALTSPPSGLAVSGGNVYWAVQGTDAYIGSNGAIESAPIGGGTVTTLVPNQATPTSLAADAMNLYWTNLGSFDSTFGDYGNNGSVMQATLSGANPTTVADKQLAPQAIAVDASNLYWANSGFLTVDGDTGVILAGPGSGSVMFSAIGGDTINTAASGQDAPTALTASGGDIYWLNGGTMLSTGTLNRFPVSGGSIQVLATGLVNPSSLLVNGGSVFFIDFGTGNDDGAILELTPSN